ncbi:hypothetical protein [Anaeromyxobacter oryzae]|uniref:Lipoprotein n=1 Tax=Anaeromyxobacter oryzae TaxID=2918170 RepID=A0ABM7WTB3_9BACT|nr:hypothetical protein [Anaeromyxobacter oryzae]BDG02708.1 hypothetical protein AMOR_17040 [Anaeromyxobacter oryzae]
MTRRFLPVVALSLAVLLPGCRRTATPADRYRLFANAARNQDSAAVWGMLSKRSRADFDARAKALAAAAPGVLPARGQDVVVGDLAVRAPKVKSTVILRESADAAVIAVEDEAGVRGEVTLVREDGDWKVEVPRAGG